MPNANYKELYFKLLGNVADSIDALIAAIRDAEEEYCDDEAHKTEEEPKF